MKLNIKAFFLSILLSILTLSGCGVGSAHKYTYKELKDAWEKDGPTSPFVVAAGEACDKALQDGKNHQDDECRIYEIVSSEQYNKELVKEFHKKYGK